MADRTTPVSIGRAAKAESPGGLSEALGTATGGVLSLLIDVVDREDRLESGSGAFRMELGADLPGRRRTVEEAVLRALRMAADPLNYRVVEVLADAQQATTTEIGRAIGLPRLAVEERVSDLVSAGLAVKVFSSGQISSTQAGAALVELVRRAAATAASFLEAR